MNELEVLYNNGIKECYKFKGSKEEVLNILNITIESFQNDNNGYITLPSEDNWGTIIRLSQISKVTLLNKLE